jgi:excisionase family DNA binding protein
VKLLNKPNVRRITVDEATFAKLYEVADPELKPIILVAYDTGMRKGEILNLRWSQLDLREGTIKLSAADTKTNFPRTVYLATRPARPNRRRPHQLRADGVRSCLARPRGFEPLAFGFVARPTAITAPNSGMQDCASAGNHEGWPDGAMQADTSSCKPFATPLLPTTAADPRRRSARTEALLSIGDVAERVGVCRATVYRMVWRGDIPHIRVGAAIRIHPADLDRLLARRRG